MAKYNKDIFTEIRQVNKIKLKILDTLKTKSDWTMIDCFLKESKKNRNQEINTDIAFLKNNFFQISNCLIMDLIDFDNFYKKTKKPSILKAKIKTIQQKINELKDMINEDDEISSLLNYAAIIESENKAINTIYQDEDEYAVNTTTPESVEKFMNSPQSWLSLFDGLKRMESILTTLKNMPSKTLSDFARYGNMIDKNRNHEIIKKQRFFKRIFDIGKTNKLLTIIAYNLLPLSKLLKINSQGDQSKLLFYCTRLIGEASGKRFVEINDFLKFTDKAALSKCRSVLRTGFLKDYSQKNLW